MGAVFGVFAGFYYWIGKMTGFTYPEFWGKVHFWTLFVGVYKIKLAPFNLAWCWNIYFKILHYIKSNLLDILKLEYLVEGNKGFNIENCKIKKDRKNFE